MNSTYRDGWPEIAERFEAWWARAATDRPLLWIVAPRDTPLPGAERPPDPPLPDKYLDAAGIMHAARARAARTAFLGDAFPTVDGNLGPGSLALYLGSEPVFRPDTVWFTPCLTDLDTDPLPTFDPQNRWFSTHLDLIRALREGAGDDMWVTIPDLVESVDILAAMRDPMHLLYDLMDRPAACHRWLERINELYAPVYDAFYDIVKDRDGASMFTAFCLWGRGKTCKVQCDFAAMMSPAQFGEFYVPYVTRQIEGLDRILYHLDGPDCIRHVDQLVAIEKLQAIQWVAGAGKPHHGCEQWFPLYRKVLDAGKGLQVSLPVNEVVPFVKRFGARGLFIIAHPKTEREGRELLHAVAALGKTARRGKPRESSNVT